MQCVAAWLILINDYFFSALPTDAVEPMETGLNVIESTSEGAEQDASKKKKKKKSIKWAEDDKLLVYHYYEPDEEERGTM